MWKISTDYKTIVDVPENVPLFAFIKAQVPGAVDVIRDTFLAYDLKSGETKELIVMKKRGSVKVLAGMNLTEEELTAKFDKHGSKIK